MSRREAYVRSLVELLASCPPAAPNTLLRPTAGGAMKSSSRLDVSTPRAQNAATAKAKKLLWKLPQGTLSNAGRLVVLRPSSSPHAAPTGTPKSKRPAGAGKEGEITASVITDDQLRGVVWGDPFVHSMDVYCRRVQWLATRAVMGKAT